MNTDTLLLERATIVVIVKTENVPNRPLLLFLPGRDRQKAGRTVSVGSEDPAGSGRYIEPKPMSCGNRRWCEL